MIILSYQLIFNAVYIVTHILDTREGYTKSFRNIKKAMITEICGSVVLSYFIFTMVFRKMKDITFIQPWNLQHTCTQWTKTMAYVA